MQSQIPDVLVNDLSLLEEIVDEANTSEKTTDFFTDEGGFTIDKYRIVCHLDDHSVYINMTQEGDDLTFTVYGTMNKSAVTNGIAEVLATLAGNIRDGAIEIRDIAQTKYP